MKKVGLIVVVVLVVLVGGFYVLNTYIYNEKQGDSTMENTNVTNTSQPTGENTQLTTKADFTPISHAAMVLTMGGQVIYTDPIGNASAFANKPKPNVILVTDIHGDHFNLETLQAVSTAETVLVVPQVVKDALTAVVPGTVVVMKNADKITEKGLAIEAIPMYNFPEKADSRHTKGRGNGYVIEANGERVYIAGDTGDTPEIEALQNIDLAFVPMNPPLTMTIAEAAHAVLAFKPKRVVPYHYRSQDGLSNTSEFKELVNIANPNIQVDLVNFYPN